MSVRRRAYLLLVAVIVSIPIVGGLFSGKALAAETGTWVDNATITWNNQTFKDDDPYNGERRFTNHAQGGCRNEISGFPGGDWDSGPAQTYINNSKSATLIIREIPPGGACVEKSRTAITLSPAEYARAEFSYVDAGTMRKWNNAGDWVLKQSETEPRKYLRVSEAGQQCQDYIEVGANNKGIGTFYEHNPAPFGPPTVPGCFAVSDVRQMYISNLDLLAIPPGQGNPNTGPGSGTATPTEPTCESSGGKLTWLLCPLLKLLDEAAGALDDQIQGLLSVSNPADPNSKLSQDPAGAANNLRATWARLRNIAVIILVPILLVMVLGTALGFSFVDAYTVRRAMPRFLIAVLFISLSWYITGFLIDITNTVGKGILGLMTSSFGGTADLTLAKLVKTGTGATASWGGFVIFGGLALAGVVSFGILLSFAFAAAVALFIGFLALTLRAYLILALVLLAPLAILGWIFPNNDKMWKLWWGTFSKLLLMFPLVMVLIGSGKIFAKVISVTNPGFIGGLMIIIAYIVPYFFIPFAFKAAGGLFGTLTGMVNDRTKGLFDRQKKYRQEARGRNVEQLKAGNRFRGSNPFSRRASRALQTASLVGAGGLTLSTAKRRERMNVERGHRNFDLAMEALEKNADIAAISGDDDKLWAVMNGTDEASVERELIARAPERFTDPLERREAVAEVMRAKRSLSSEVGRIAATVAQAGTGTGYNYKFDDNRDDMFDAIIGASGGDANLQGRMLAKMRPMASQSGRPGLAGGGYALSARVMAKRREALANGGWITETDPTTGVRTRRTYGEADARLEVMQDVLQSNAGAAVAGKVEDVRQMATIMKTNIEKELTGPSATPKVAARELAKLAGKYDAAGQIAPQNAEALADGALAQEIDVGSLHPEIRKMLDSAITTYHTEEVHVPDPVTGEIRVERRTQPVSSQTKITYQQAIEALRGNSDFQTMRREYQTAGIAAANAASAAAQLQAGGNLPPIAGTTGP